MPRSLTNHELQKRINEMRFIVAIEDFIFYLQIHTEWDKKSYLQQLGLAEKLLIEKNERAQFALQDNQPTQTQNAASLQKDTAKEYLEQLQQLFSALQGNFASAVEEACAAINRLNLDPVTKAAAIDVVKQTLTMQAMNNVVNQVLANPQPINSAPQFKPINLILADAHEHLHEPITKAHSEYESSVNQRENDQDGKALFLDFTRLLLNLAFARNAKNHPGLTNSTREAMLDIFNAFQKPAMNLALLNYGTMTVPENRHDFLAGISDLAGNPFRFRYAEKPIRIPSFGETTQQENDGPLPRPEIRDK
ncbi:MAG: hypothetical protein NTZ67_01000 [Gammaproteobacteria bacterium]|nr:hypothetical protein [Gammaproteobacteria bacterium]